MERNADDMFGATGGQGTNPGGTGMAGTGAPAGGSDYSANQSNAAGTTDTVGTSGQTNTVDQAKTTVQNKFSQVKDKARELQSTLADRLDAGADKLRQRTQNVNANATLAGATTGASTSVATDDRVANVQDSVARGMQKSADWLRNGDLKTDIERQVRENPGRTLLIALGVGYILGKAFRNNR